MQSISFTPVITKATRFPPGDSRGAPSLLNQIWLNSHKYVAGIIAFDNTDNCPVFIKLPLTSSVNNKIKLTIRAHKADCIAQFKNEVQSIITGVDFFGDVERVTSKLMSDLHNTYNGCFPVRVKYVSQKRIQNQWITSGI